MQIVSSGDNLHEMSKSVFWEKCEKIHCIMNLSSSDLAQREVKINYHGCWGCGEVLGKDICKFVNRLLFCFSYAFLFSEKKEE